MKMHWVLHRVLSVLLFIAGAQGQKPTSTGAAAPPTQVSATVEEVLPLTPDRKAAVRELQYNVQKAEIRVQQLQVEIDEVTIRDLREINTLRQQQVGWNSDISVIATDFARVKQVDFSGWELDQVNLRLVKKKPSTTTTDKPALK